LFNAHRRRIGDASATHRRADQSKEKKRKEKKTGKEETKK